MSGPNGDPSMSAEDGIINDEDEFGDEEYGAINSMLDQINSYLDHLEERNDALNGKLHDLMEDNRQARQEFRDQLIGSPDQEDLPGLPADQDPSPPTNEDTAESKMSEESG
ncbi:bublin coiled-coil protein [Genypterus blacodes]|uniref:bublin coiled-coil protein n=1 Tax=Genypterus blacodes TaxID=154954 RepID=UPI003F76E88B